MRLALALGRRGNGSTWPNPSVGAVLTDPASGTIIAQARTQPGGRPHAEPLAIAAAGEAARGATLYVSLEPCSHHGKTPPCADAIVAAGIGRVVTALEDADARVAGRGHARLRAAGIPVEIGIGAAEAERAHRGHLTRVRLGRPAVTLKLARTPDGYAGASPGEPRLLVTAEAANAHTHLLRVHADAVMVGIGTVLADDPRLDVRLPGLEARSPLRVVIDPGLRLPLGSRLFATAHARPLWVLCGSEADREAAARLTDAGAHLIPVGTGPDGRLDLRAALTALGQRGLSRVLCEGGPLLAESLAAADLVDEIVLMTGSVPLGRPGLPAVRPGLAAALGRFTRSATEFAGPDRIEHFERAPCSPGS